ncbi:MAG: PilZ domain-containing protein [Myxococcota bacterium]
MRVVIIDHQVDGLEEFLAWLRGHPKWMSTPVIALVESPRTTSFVHVLSAGADDAVPYGDAPGLAARLVEVGSYAVKRPEATKGRALVAHPDASVRRVLGRQLRFAGFDPIFATTDDEIAARTSDCRLVVAALQGTDPLATISRLREANAKLPVVWLSSDERAKVLQHHLAGENGVAVSRRSDPSDNLLFKVNELLAGDAINARDSRRLLMSTICAYRPAGARLAAHGLTYNLSQRGLYVRSLAPLDRGTSLWFELQPSPSSPWIHLRGDVVWRRRPCDTAGAPAGFGVRIQEDECSPRDLSIWLDAYAELLDQDPSSVYAARPQTGVFPMVMGAMQ